MDAELSRRTVLRRGALAAAGLFGASKMTSAHASPLAAGIPFELTGRFFALAKEPEPGQQTNASGELLDADDNKVGEFYSTIWIADAPFGLGATSAGLVEHHTFRLTDGTIFGSGTRPSVPDTTGTYAVVGGTGLYAALVGTYTGVQAFVDLGGDGSARFTFTGV